MNKAYITPTGSGRGDGSSWEHAAKLGQINKLIEKVGPGGEVLLRADLGTYRISGPLEITKGGTAAGDVTIRGVDVNGADMLAHFKGTRMDVYTPGGAPGLDGLRLLTGANHLDIKNVKLEDFGRAIHVGSAIKDLEISNVVGENVQRFFDNDYRTGPNRDASITGLLIENVEVRGFSKGVIRLTDSTNDVVIRNVYGDSERQDKDNFAQGVHLTENVHNVLIENTTMRNSHSSLGAYWNGDGFVTEKGVSNVRFINTVATGSTDAGYDLKSTDTVLIGAYAADNKRNYRIWSDEVTIIDSISVDAFNRQTGGGGAHVWVSDNRVANLVNFSVYENNPRSIVFQADGRGSRVLLDGVDIYTVPAVRVIGTVNPAGFLTEVDGRPIVAQALLPGMMPPETGHVGSIKPMIEPPKPSVLSISASQASMGEGQFGQTETSFTITRTGPSDKEASVSWAVAGSGPAAADAKDFTGDALPAGTVQFAAGETTKTVVVTVKADRLVEADESFTVTLSAPTNAQIGESSVRMTILNDDPLATGITTIAAANAVDLSARGHQVVSGPAHHNIFFVNSEAATGRDTILNFGKDDVLVTTRALHDGNRDGLITYSRNTLSIDGPGGQDAVVFGKGGPNALRHLGATDDGLNVYADASVRPARALEGTVGDDQLRGDAGDAVVNRFFFDTALDIDLGNDRIDDFGMKDLIITTSRLADVGGRVNLMNGALELPGGSGAAQDGYFAGEGGTVTVRGQPGAPVGQLEYDGAITRKGVTYHVYSASGSQVGLADF